jgi:acetolactate synthase-1/3 small subunit
VGKDRDEIKRMVDIFRAKVIDVTDKTYTVEITGMREKLSAFVEAIDSTLILEVVRTGACGLGRGERILKI